MNHPHSRRWWDLLPREPVTRREAEEHIRAASGLAVVVMVASLIFVPLIGTHADVFSVARVIVPVFAFSVFGYYNARCGYRYYSANVQEWLGMLALVAAGTYLIHLAGSTATTGTSLYVLLIVFSSVFVGPRAGVAACLATTLAYGVLTQLEQAGALEFSPDMPAKQVLLAFPEYHLQTFFAVGILNGVTLGVAWYITRVLARRRAEVEDANRRLRALDETKSRFLSIVSHDLRTPITAIKAYGEMVEENVSGQDKTFLRTIVQEADRLNRLVTDLLDLDKMEAGKMEWTLTSQDIRPVLRNALQVFAAAATEKNVTLTGNIAEELPFVRADADRLAQLVANLLSNAIKFTPPGGSVTLRATPLGVPSPFQGEGQDGGTKPKFHSGTTTLALPLRGGGERERPARMVCIAVSDTGPGIASDDLARIFDRFSQTATGRKAGGGTGLGLAIAREIAHGHGGDIRVTSTVGSGSEFLVSLPATA